jgi:succinate dehydrogenase/fumarate reductase flavoprotein subunit
MKRRFKENQELEATEKQKGVSRRSFLTGAGGVSAAVAVAATGLLGGSALDAASGTQAAAACRVTKELPIPDTYEADRPKQTEYSVDVLVIGGGYAGMNAAYTAKKAGRSVLLLDKGRPGYSGQSPWPGTFNYFDPDMGDSEQLWREYNRYGAEYFGNLDWIDIWMKESKTMYERIKSWGVLEMYPRMCETKYFATRDYYGYRDNVVGNKERRPKFVEVLDKNNIPWLQHVMVTHVIVQDGRCVGAVGLQFTTGAMITVHAKAVVMAMGNGAIMSTGHPIGDNTFDGEYIAYHLGLPIGGKEFEDFHTHQSFAPGNNWIGSDARYFDPNFLCGGNFTLELLRDEKKICDSGASQKATNPEGLSYIDSAPIADACPTKGSAQSAVYGKNPKEVRMGKVITPYVRFDAPGAAVGMCLHLTSGVFCGMDDKDGYTGIPGLYVAGDGIHLTNPGGANYKMGNGFTSCFVAIEGDHAGKSASAYCDKVSLTKIADANIAKAKEEIEQPLKLKTGFSPGWARDVLQGIMAPYWVMKNKSEATLKAALTQVEYMRDRVAPRLLARSGHDLRLCHEMKHKINACELKLRAALARKESRGVNFYREDYPKRNDAEWLKYILQQKDKNGKPSMSFVPVKKEWTAAGIPADFKF